MSSSKNSHVKEVDAPEKKRAKRDQTSSLNKENVSSKASLTKVTPVTAGGKSLPGSNSGVMNNTASAVSTAAVSGGGPSASVGRSPFNPLETEPNQFKVLSQSITESMMSGFDIMSSRMADMMGKNLNQIQQSLCHGQDRYDDPHDESNAVPDHMMSESEPDSEACRNQLLAQASGSFDDVYIDENFLDNRIQTRREDEKVGAPVSEKMENYVKKCFESPISKATFDDLHKKRVIRPSNCEWLQSPIVDPVVWRQLPPATHIYEPVVQQAQKVVCESMAGIARAIDLITQRDVMGGLNCLADTLEISAYSSHVVLNDERKDKIKSKLPGQYKMISGSDEQWQVTTPTSLLGDVKEGVTRAAEANKISEQIYKAKKDLAARRRGPSMQKFGRGAYKAGSNQRSGSQGFKPPYKKWENRNQAQGKPQPREQSGFGKPKFVPRK